MYSIYLFTARKKVFVGGDDEIARYVFFYTYFGGFFLGTTSNSCFLGSIFVVIDSTRRVFRTAAMTRTGPMRRSGPR